VQCVRLLRVEAQNRLVKAGGLVDAAVLVVADGFGEKTRNAGVAGTAAGSRRRPGGGACAQRLLLTPS